ncbi:MAG TPA: Lrp/AsnC family transcriptional regulator [Pseudonocardia sp.]|nr:Lrp/AsnC family transcriptional regulator [Pseudonocardia sp.]
MTSDASATGIDELDVALLDALHVNPRASFQQLGTALGVSAVTAARRWRRLAGSRRAWVCSTPGPRLAVTAAIFEVECVPGRTGEVGRALAGVAQVASVYLTAGSYDLVALVLAPELGTLSALLLDHLSNTPGIARVRSSIVTSWYSDVRWRLGAISATQWRSVRDADADAGQARAGRDRPGEARTLHFDRDDRSLYLALQADGRARYRDLAALLDTSEQQVKRRMDALVRDGRLAFRTDFTRTEGGWPTQLALWLLVPDDRLAEVGAEIARWPDTRLCLSALGPANLFVKLQLHRLDDVRPLFDRLGGAVPTGAPVSGSVSPLDGSPPGVVADRRLVLGTLKSFGRLLDTAGRSTGVIPVDPWAPISS